MDQMHTLLSEQKAAIAERIRGLRSILELTPEEAADAAKVSVEEYLEYESGAKSFPYWFLHNCAALFDVDILELISGDTPHLTGYTVARGATGLSLKRVEGFNYTHLAPLFRKRLAEVFIVTVPFNESAPDSHVEMDAHDGQEFDYVLDGKLRFVFEDHEEDLCAGDSVYYNSGRAHGVLALDGKPCTILAVVIKPRRDRSNA